MKLLSILIIGLFFSGTHSNIEEKTDFELIVFEGSDWCSNCRQFESAVLSDERFIEYLEKEHIKLTKVDFPQREKLSPEQQEINRKYAEKYQFAGVFPTIVLSRINNSSYINLNFRNQTIDQFIQLIVDSIEAI